nr:MAG TPA: hypothetical protein [Caudoviricetes sp.]
MIMPPFFVVKMGDFRVGVTKGVTVWGDSF